MGTQNPLVHIEAATLAGGDNNQDRYAYGDGWAFVLDGASSFGDTPPVHDGGWYAERLKNSLAKWLDRNRQVETTAIVYESIREAIRGHDESTQGPCPTSTIALARWESNQVSLYVLGDSRAVVSGAAEEKILLLQDSRIENFGAEYRSLYQSRLRDGHGFSEEHQRLLDQLQMAQKVARNKPGGYWVAGGDPGAANYGLTRQVEIKPETRIVLATDGIPNDSIPCLVAATKTEGRELSDTLAKLQAKESDDPLGQLQPRSKLHDDKTVVVMEFW